MLNLDDFLDEVATSIVEELRTKDYETLSLEAQTLLRAYNKNGFNAYDFQNENNLLLKHILFRENIRYDDKIEAYDNFNFLEKISVLSKKSDISNILERTKNEKIKIAI